MTLSGKFEGSASFGPCRTGTKFPLEIAPHETAKSYSMYHAHMYMIDRNTAVSRTCAPMFCEYTTVCTQYCSVVPERTKHAVRTSATANDDRMTDEKRQMRGSFIQLHHPSCADRRSTTANTPRDPTLDISKEREPDATKEVGRRSTRNHPHLHPYAHHPTTYLKTAPPPRPPSPPSPVAPPPVLRVSDGKT